MARLYLWSPLLHLTTNNINRIVTLLNIILNCNKHSHVMYSKFQLVSLKLYIVLILYWYIVTSWCHVIKDDCGDKRVKTLM